MGINTKMENIKRNSGVLLHITSLPNEYRLGCFSSECHRFIDWLYDSGFRTWQILPLVDCGYGGCPYNAHSSFAINPYLIDISEFLSAEEIASFGFDKSQPVYSEQDKLDKALDLIYDKFSASSPRTEFDKKNSYWLDDYALYKVIKSKHNHVSWQEFPVKLRDRNKVALTEFRNKYAREIDKVKFLQFVASNQWENIHNYAKSKGIKIFGDVPYYVCMDSADVWSNPKNWKLATSTTKGEIAGIPPDCFNADGQLWGNPIYDFKSMALDKYKYMTSRFTRAEELVDYIRIDHFVAFGNYYSIPANSKTAKNGKWVKGEGDKLLSAITSKLKAPIIAEDLGMITPEVVKLREKFNIPGLKLLQYAFHGDCDDMYKPHHWGKDSVGYLGTHDNDTYKGMLDNIGSWEHLNRIKKYLRMPLEWGNDAVIDQSIIAMYQSNACMIIITMQDILKLGSDCRMNIPGTTENNWLWQMNEMPSREICSYYADLAYTYGRL